MTTGQGGNGGGGGSSASSANCVGGNSGSNGGGATPCNGDVYFVSSDDLWAQRGALGRMVDMLLTAGFDVSLTADHGNIEARGVGKPNVGATAEERGERVHVFRDSMTRSKIEAAFIGSISWPPIGLPENYLPLIAPARKAFITEGKHTVAHGGVCIEEVIVPFVQFSRSP